MKVKGAVLQTQVVEGTISASDLLALVRETFQVPEGVVARFYATDNLYGAGMQLSQHVPGLAPQLIDVTDSSPLKFRIEWRTPIAKNEQG